MNIILKCKSEVIKGNNTRELLLLNLRKAEPKIYPGRIYPGRP